MPCDYYSPIPQRLQQPGDVGGRFQPVMPPEGIGNNVIMPTPGGALEPFSGAGRQQQQGKVAVLGTPPGIEATGTNANATIAAASDAAVASINLEDVKRLAAQEHWSCVQSNLSDSVVSFGVVRDGENVYVNVYYDVSVAGIMFDHQRMGKTQCFRRDVDLFELCKIFRDPRAQTGAGYSNMKMVKPHLPRKGIAIGDRVHVSGYPDAVVIEGPKFPAKFPSDLVKIRFADGSAYRVSPSALSIADRRVCAPKCLEGEVELQLKRLNHELERIKKEKSECQQILRLRGSKHVASIHDDDMNHVNQEPEISTSLRGVTSSRSTRCVTGVDGFESLNEGIHESIWYSEALNQGGFSYLGNGFPPYSASSMPQFLPDQMEPY